MFVSRPRAAAARAAVITTAIPKVTRGRLMLSLRVRRRGGSARTGWRPPRSWLPRPRGGVLRGRAPADDVVDEVLVAAQARRLEDRGIPRLDLDRLVEVLEGEALRVVVPVARLRQVLGHERVREVAVDALRDGMVRAL